MYMQLRLLDNGTRIYLFRICNYLNITFIFLTVLSPMICSKPALVCVFISSRAEAAATDMLSMIVVFSCVCACDVCGVCVCVCVCACT